jgi:predicted esterase
MLRAWTLRRSLTRAMLALALLLAPTTVLRAEQGAPAAGPQPAPAAGEEAPPADAAAQEEADYKAAVQGLLGRVEAHLPQSTEARRSMLLERPDAFALGMLKLEKADLAMRLYAGSESGRAATLANLEAAADIWEALSAGEEPELARRGILERAYLATNDMSAQPYLLYVPPDYDAAEPWGLLVFLHGYSNLNKLNWIGNQYSPALETLAEKGRCIVAVPYGRSNTDFQGIGEDDVLRVIEEVKDRYNVDEDRVFLSGISMGGMGVWTIGGHRPHLFAGLISLAGRADFYMWKGIAPDSLPRFKALLVEGEFGAGLLPNYANLRSVIVHGLLDIVMPIGQSERMHELLSERGYEVTLSRVPGASHYTWTPLITDQAVLDCLEAARREPAPREITLRAYTLKHGRAYWAEITGKGSWSRPAELACELDEAAGTLIVETQNVASLRLEPPVEEPERLRVVWNGEPAPVRPVGDGVIELGAAEEEPEELLKTAALCGPIREAYAGPFVIVYGGGRGGESFQRAVQGAADWVRFAQGVPQLLSAEAVTDEVIEHFNLVLYGPPEDNEVLARIAPDLPIGIGDGRYTLGERSYDASRYGLSMIYPNPLAPEHYVVVNCGPVWGAELAPNHKYDMLPDFIVFADERAEDGTESNRHVCAGFFDGRWRLSEESTWHAPERADVTP